MRLHATIQGHVQGVGFRVFVQQYAANLKLTGWVRNT
ncbi:MAG TPA: acylphosphatase, partial [Anaerolineaceae bacterium]|nr:acylphosphatase [Anaerolineaceae bacterium]